MRDWIDHSTEIHDYHVGRVVLRITRDKYSDKWIATCTAIDINTFRQETSGAKSVDIAKAWAVKAWYDWLTEQRASINSAQ